MLTRIATVLAFVVCTAGCGGDAGIDGSKRLSSLDDLEKSDLCDWLARKAGGYGLPSACAYAVLEAPSSQAACIADFPSPISLCGDVLVRQLQACAEKLIAAQAACTPQEVELARFDENCQPVLASRCFD